MMTEREKQLEEALAQFIKPIKNLPFEVIVKSIYDSEVKKFDLDLNGDIFQRIVRAMRETCRLVQKTPIKRPRPNEVGNDMEPYVIQTLQAEGLRAEKPETKSGKGKSTGYPDVKIICSPSPIFLEVKTYALKNSRTTQRSFYFSPSKDHKVIHDGYHLLVGFEIHREVNSFTPQAFKLVDLYGLNCDMKAEFNSDNSRLYQEERILFSENM